MSVLNFPRIYLNGFMFWNPPTFNNNDVLPLYDAVKMQMNWRFLSEYGINDKNAPQTLMPWGITPLAYQNVPDYVLQVPTNGDPNSYPMIPAEWDLFGDNACGTVDYQQFRSVIIGGESKVDSYIDNDPLINKSYQLLGNSFGNPSPTAARFVDISPWQNTFTALYFDKITLGDTTCGVTLKQGCRMLNRFLDFNWGAFGGLVYVTCTWQTCFTKDQVDWFLGGSQLLQNLKDEMEQNKDAQGLMLRFTTYLTVYDKNGLFNDFKIVNSHSQAPWDMSRLQMLYQIGLDNPTETFFNPAYSRTAGTLGLWLNNEFPTAPAGQRLTPLTPVDFYKKVPGDTVIHKPEQVVNLGVLSAQLNGSTLSLDLGNTFPSYPAVHDLPAAPDLDGRNNAIPVAAKFHVGDYELGVQQGGNFEPLTGISFDQYQQSNFDKRSGLLDLPLDAGAQALLKNGNLALRLKGTDTIAAQQQMWTAEVIESGSFIDVGDSRTLNIMVQYNGKPAPAGTTLWVAEYNNAFMLTTSNYYLAFSNPADFVLIKDLPDMRAKNEPGMPQFVDSSQHPSLFREGSGRRLSAMIVKATACDEPVSTPITYQEFLKTPAAVDLRPCLKFDKPQPMTGKLDNDAGLGATVNYSLTSIKTNADGIAQLTVQAVAPGFPTLRFFIQDDPTGIPFSFSYTDAFTDFLSPLRVLPQEPQMLKDFIDCWNRVYQFDDANVRIWKEFIFPQILQPFYYLYPIMNKYMPLNSLQRIEGAIEQFITLISKEYQEASTLAMPITRDLPQSRRQVLEIWAKDLVSTGYPPTPLDLNAYQQG
ncbi:putative uncharacterized protein [Pseudomonas sp. Os17]|uniref:hypothetical protein n=1 Tax=unclassified Pseudomonas TaxID=196821 RepID=UPI0005FC529F|nr:MULTISPECIES: hypothetical protein [unclassified Pseudomonas]ULT71435.1 hypothetical protein L1O02_03425 [Pseudomonas sp. BC42]BAQ77188.1 putative uncharacterized protein [Pseudomonas sp. Os17]